MSTASDPAGWTIVEALRHGDVLGPRYDRSQIRVGIVHIGVGGFHRAHQAAYLHDLMNRGEAAEWGICGIGLLPADQRMRDALLAQDFLYSLTLRDPDGTSRTEIIGSIVDYVWVPEDPAAAIARIADPGTKIISLTVTEGGYFRDEQTGRVLLDHPDLSDDLTHLESPRTHAGLVLAGLRRRWLDGGSGVTVQSCDNLRGNGRIVGELYVGLAQRIDPDFADWVQSQVTFPSSMVDRITPVTTDADRAELTARCGLADRWPVVAEPFTQWVIEDNFAAGRPDWEKVGAQLVSEVEPYELMKLRLLNASHQALCYFSALAGITTVAEAMRHRAISGFVRNYLAREGVPSVPEVPGVDLGQYQEQLLHRFANPGISDTIARLCADTSDRIPQWLVPVLSDNLVAGRSVDIGAAIIASWERYAATQPSRVVDRRREPIVAQARKAQDLDFVRQREFFGDLADNETFAAAYRRARGWLVELDPLAAAARVIAELD